MPFQMSEKAIFEEEIMEAICFYQNFIADMEKVIEAINLNQTLDHENDKMRADVTRHLISALSAHNMRDYDDVNRHVNAAMQRLHGQEAADLRDDIPRTQALIKLSVSIQKAASKAESLKRFLSKMNGEKDHEK